MLLAQLAVRWVGTIDPGVDHARLLEQRHAPRALRGAVPIRDVLRGRAQPFLARPQLREVGLQLLGRRTEPALLHLQRALQRAVLLQRVPAERQSGAHQHRACAVADHHRLPSGGRRLVTPRWLGP